MGFMRCPFCEQEIDSQAKKCFFCDSDLSNLYYHEDSKQIEEIHEKTKIEHPIGVKNISLILLLGAAFLGMAFFLINHFN